jgi:aspartyl-tRNA(Asn)/glutamyl-tRNA(Gln) amidotransferase subunit B
MSVEYEPVIGLEVHVQLGTSTKLFCSCPVTFGEEPNSRVCPVCSGLPGVLPVLNKKAVEYAVRSSLALGCRISLTSIFARKNYFYPDLPKGYQISQYEYPLAVDGALHYRIEGKTRQAGIKRIHLEEEAGKLIHSQEEDVSWIDYNRAGIPLVEIVSEPEFRSPRESCLYLQRLRQVLLYLGVSDVRMEEGSLRCDANVSVRMKGDKTLGVKTEIKNMNSFKSVEAALRYEIDRQTRFLEEGRTITQDTLLWDEVSDRASVMRTKEGEDDYRYFPEPDLPPLVIEEGSVEEIRMKLPELPWEKEERFMTDYRLPEYDVRVLTADPDLADYYEAVLKGFPDPKVVSNWVMGDVMARLKLEGIAVKNLKVKPRDLADLLTLMREGLISRKIASEVFKENAATGSSPARIVKERGMVQVTDPDKIAAVVEKVLEDHPHLVEKYRSGKKEVLGYLVGQVMKETDGMADPELANEILRKALGAL